MELSRGVHGTKDQRYLEVVSFVCVAQDTSLTVDEVYASHEDITNCNDVGKEWFHLCVGKLNNELVMESSLGINEVGVKCLSCRFCCCAADGVVECEVEWPHERLEVRHGWVRAFAVSMFRFYVA